MLLTKEMFGLGKLVVFNFIWKAAKHQYLWYIMKKDFKSLGLQIIFALMKI